MNAKIVLSVALSMACSLGCTLASTSEFRMLLYSADNGDAADQYNVGVLYTGTTLRDPDTKNELRISDKDMGKAVKYLQMSAAQGFTPARIKLANIYAYGPERLRNNEEAFNLYLTAAKEGNAEAQYEVGKFYELGKGVQKDEGLARIWFERASSNGVLRAKLRLGDVDEAAGAAWSRLKRWFSDATSDMQEGYNEEERRQDMEEFRKLFGQ